jgi:predicted Zn finger-like uncharacterized protein
MFTVCPKCALTLVVTAADLRVAQGYVRCGRCSNVFNAIVGLTEGGGAHPPGGPGAQAGFQGNASPPSTATTSIIRKAPSISDDDRVPDRINDTGENEPIYAEPEPDLHEMTVDDVLAEAAKQAAKTAPPPKNPPPAPPEPEPERFTDTIPPDTSLEFNPAATDVSQVFIEAPPAKKIDLRGTGTFETIKLKPDPPPPAPAPPPAARRQPAPPPPRDPEDLQLEDELRLLAARLDATGKQPVLKTEPPGKPAAAKGERPGPATAPKPESATEDAKSSYSGSPYNSADALSNIKRKIPATGPRRATAPRETEPADEVIASEAADELTPRKMPRGRRLAWIGGSIALGLGLAAQAIHHNRHDLATSARLNRPLTRFYAAIGVPLVPRWNLALYDVRQLGAFSGAGDNGNLTVRASLKNTADQPLPLPLLRITVQDRYGNRIATRDVPPKGYVPGALPQDAKLGVGQRIDAEMSFKDPGRDAVGFEIDACLPTPEGGIACANETAAAAAR